MRIPSSTPLPTRASNSLWYEMKHFPSKASSRHFKQLDANVNTLRKHIHRPLCLTEKILYSHLEGLEKQLGGDRISASHQHPPTCTTQRLHPFYLSLLSQQSTPIPPPSTFSPGDKAHVNPHDPLFLRQTRDSSIDEAMIEPFVRGSDFLYLNPDHLAMQDATAQMALLQFMSSAIDTVQLPATVHCDHLIVAKDEGERDLRNALQTNQEVYDFLKTASLKHGLGFWHPGSGIIHQIVLEKHAFPGGLMIGTDSHTPNAGGLGMMAIGVGGADAVDAMVGQPWELLAPRVIGVKLTGQLGGWSSHKDVICRLAGILGVKGGTNSVIEYYGEGVDTLSCTGMATIANMGAEVGATCSIFPYTQAMRRYLRATDRSSIATLCDRAHENLLQADSPLVTVANSGEQVDTSSLMYDRVVEINLAALEPQINGPFSPDLNYSVSQLADTMRHDKEKDKRQREREKQSLLKKERRDRNMKERIKSRSRREVTRGSIAAALGQEEDEEEIVDENEQDEHEEKDAVYWPNQISACLIGSCTNSSYEDMTRVASLARQAIKHGVRCKVPFYVTPGSEQIRATMQRDGLLRVLQKVGATVLSNACGPCIGQWSRPSVKLGELNTIVNSYNRNFAKRNDGNPGTCAFVTSPEVTLAYALHGKLSCNPMTDPIAISDTASSSSSSSLCSPSSFVLSPPKGEALPAAEIGFSEGRSKLGLQVRESNKTSADYEVHISPTSSRIQALTPFPANDPSYLHTHASAREQTHSSEENEEEGRRKTRERDIDVHDARVLIKVQGKCTTDHISPAAVWLKYRGHLDNISDNLLMGALSASTQEVNLVHDYLQESENLYRLLSRMVDRSIRHTGMLERESHRKEDRTPKRDARQARAPTRTQQRSQTRARDVVFGLELVQGRDAEVEEEKEKVFLHLISTPASTAPPSFLTPPLRRQRQPQSIHKGGRTSSSSPPSSSLPSSSSPSYSSSPLANTSYPLHPRSSPSLLRSSPSPSVSPAQREGKGEYHQYQQQQQQQQQQQHQREEMEYGVKGYYDSAASYDGSGAHQHLQEEEERRASIGGEAGNDDDGDALAASVRFVSSDFDYDHPPEQHCVVEEAVIGELQALAKLHPTLSLQALASVSSVARHYQQRGVPWLVIGEDNYGEGSSREHAALEKRHLGGRAVLVKSFARIHETNLKKQGVLPLTFQDAKDYDRIKPEAVISVLGLAHLAPHKPVQIQVKQPKGPAVSASESLLSSSTAQPQLHQLIRALIPHRLAMLHRRGEERARTKEQTQAARLFPPQTEDKEEASESSGRNKHSARELGARAGSVPEDNAGGDLEEEEKRFVLSMSSYGIEGEDEVEDETELETFVLEVNHSLNWHQIEWWRAGSACNAMRPELGHAVPVTQASGEGQGRK